MLDLASFFGNRVLKMAKLGSLRRATRRPSTESNHSLEVLRGICERKLNHENTMKDVEE